MYIYKFTRGLCLRSFRSNIIILTGETKQSIGLLANLSTARHHYQTRRLNTSCRHLQQAPTDDLMVYSGPLSHQVRRVKLFSLVTSLAGLAAQPAILERAHDLGATVGTVIGVCSMVGFFTFVTPLMLHWVTKKYVTSVVYHVSTNSYTATTYSLFVREKTHNFRAEEAIVPDVPGMFTSVIVKGTPLFLDARFFEDLTHYEKIMGYDKPMDFKLKQGTISPMDHVASKQEK